MSLLKRAASFYTSRDFERHFDSFIEEYGPLFEDDGDAKATDTEHKHVFKEAHDTYLAHFEAALTDFLAAEGSTITEFYDACREISEEKYTALFEEHQYAWFLERLLAAMEYTAFYTWMAMSIIERAANYCASPAFERVFDEFAEEHAPAFFDAARSDDVEHKHEYKELHNAYLKLFEDRLSGFLEDEGGTVSDFYDACKDVMEQKGDLAEYKWFLDRLHASMEYKLFYGLMVNEARQQLRSRK
ncbi:hypothetical protein ACHHYP_02235 [Achlya hypogyna]|uniref:Cilia- and flagella-associated protein 36 n=1 Tax=Achlya hypogyna TaxID=1202772 RepID=A0A1V9ZS38_ACHHY|nr:hypothetical protein ACHHYP_02235 [Achlya hypogyna]